MPREIMAVAMRGETMPPTPYNPCMKPKMTVPFIKFTIQEFEVAKNNAMPVPRNQKAATTTGNGGAQISIM